MPKFIVVKVEGRKETAIVDGHKNEVIYPTAKAAQHVADLLTVNLGIKHQLRPIKNEHLNWRKREQDRLDSGEYTKVPWASAKWFQNAKDCVDHFLHVSKEDPSQIAFTESNDKGLLDKQVRMAPSKYLTRFFAKQIKEATIRRWLAVYKKKYGSNFDLKLARTAKEIVKVYTEGPSSCMKGNKYVSVYATPDLAVAYIQKKDRIVARTVVWPKKKLYCNYCYGDTELIREVLKEEGYKASNRFKGARLKRLQAGVKHSPLPSIEMASQGIDYGNGNDPYITIR